MTTTQPVTDWKTQWVDSEYATSSHPNDAAMPAFLRARLRRNVSCANAVYREDQWQRRSKHIELES